jgi:hypothetical protein
MAEHPTIIEARGLKRSFKARGAKGKAIDAVRGIDLTVREGEIVAIGLAVALVLLGVWFGARVLTAQTK